MCAPKGQVIEGFLTVAPFECIGAYSSAPAGHLAELVELTETITQFYERAYRTARATVYEQGRAGGGAVLDATDHFPLHAHLCFLPLEVDLHRELERSFGGTAVSNLTDLPVAAANEPYLYIECAGAKVVYLARTPQERLALESFRLKPIIARLIGRPERGNWREAPRRSRLRDPIRRWRTHVGHGWI